MDFSQDITLPADPHRVGELLDDERFVSRRVESAGAVDHKAVITPTQGGGFTVDVSAAIPTTIIPSTYRGLVSDPIQMRMVEEWSGADESGRRTADFTLDVAGLPVRVWGTEELLADDDGAGSVIRYRGTVKSSIPIVGKKIEGAVAGAVGTVVEAGRRIAIDELNASS